MTLTELKKQLETLGLPIAYREYPEGKTPEAPFIVYYQDGTDNFSADGIVYLKVDNCSIEMYFDEKMTEIEEEMEKLLDGMGIFWNKEEFWIESEKYIEVLYKI